MLHLAWRRAGRRAGLLLILLVSGACHKAEPIGLYSGIYTVNSSGAIGIADSDLPLFLAESYGRYIVSLSELGDLTEIAEVLPPIDETPDDEISLPTPKLFSFPYFVSLRCVGVPCEGAVLRGEAELVINLDDEFISLKSMDIRSDDEMYHLTASVKQDMSGLSSSKLESGSFTVKEMDSYELSKSVHFSLVDEYSEETLEDKVIPESEMRINTEAGFYLQGFGM